MNLVNRVIAIFFVTLLYFLLTVHDSFATEEATKWKHDFTLQLKNMAKVVDDTDVQNEMDATLLFQALSIDYDIAMPATLELWLRNIVDVELIWWKQEDRATRSLILALYPYSISALSLRPRPVFFGPNFERNINRLNLREQKERREELKFVREHLSGIAKLILKTFELKTGKVEANIKEQFIQIKELKIGAPLNDQTGTDLK